jgi:hypothetical protein
MSDLEQAAREALESYRLLVEGNDQAIPMLTLTEGEAGGIVLGLTGVPQGGMSGVIDAVYAELRSTGMPTMTRAVLVNESWVRSRDPETGEETMAEAVALSAVDSTSSLLAMQTFVRTKDGVRWDGELKVIEE